MSASDLTAQPSETTGRLSLRMRAFWNANPSDDESMLASLGTRTQNPVIDKRNNRNVRSNTKAGVTLVVSNVEPADRWRQKSSASGLSGEIFSDRDRRGLRAARGIIVAILLSIGFWALVAMGFL